MFRSMGAWVPNQLLARVAWTIPSHPTHATPPQPPSLPHTPPPTQPNPTQPLPSPLPPHPSLPTHLHPTPHHPTPPHRHTTSPLSSPHTQTPTSPPHSLFYSHTLVRHTHAQRTRHARRDADDSFQVVDPPVPSPSSARHVTEDDGVGNKVTLFSFFEKAIQRRRCALPSSATLASCGPALGRP